MPKLEQISDDDIDNMDMDLADFDPDLKTHIAPKKQVNFTQPEPVNFPVPKNDSGTPTLVDENGVPVTVPGYQVTSEEKMKTYQVIYPCYFDVNRSHKQGRRVSKKLGVSNPLAKTINDSCIRLGFVTILEPEKCHPQDFGNSGRVRVLLKETDDSNDVHQATNSKIPTKRALLNLVALHLKKNPTSLSSVKELKLPGFDPQLQSDEYKPRRIPKVKGFKMNDIVPLHSPLLMGHPQLKMVYTKEPEVVTGQTTPQPQIPKKKVLKVRR